MKSLIPILNLPVLIRTEAKDINAFIDFWRRFYKYGDEDKYSDYIKLGEYSKHHVQKLFLWKNGKVLSNKNQESLKTNILTKIDAINSFKSDSNFEVEKFKNTFKSVNGAVWKIFLLHIIKPDTYPIYDQHVHRAYNFFHGKQWENIRNTIPNSSKLDFYFNTYFPFVKNLGYPDLKKLDEAFFAFGQFLNTKEQGKVFNKPLINTPTK